MLQMASNCHGAAYAPLVPLQSFLECFFTSQLQLSAGGADSFFFSIVKFKSLFSTEGTNIDF